MKVKSTISRRMASGIAGAACAMAAVHSAGAATLPTVGLEWEFTSGVGVIGFSSLIGSELVGFNLGDLLTEHDAAPLICTAEKLSGSGDASDDGDWPLVSMTFDMGDASSEHGMERRTLEVVTGPVKHDDDAQWAKVAKFIEVFFQAVNDKCATTIDKNRSDAKICFVSAKDLMDELKVKLPAELAPAEGLACGAEAYDQARTGFYVNTSAGGTRKWAMPMLSDDDTYAQVNIAVKVKTFGQKDLGSFYLAEGANREPYRALRGYKKAWETISSSAWSSVDALVKGFYVLYGASMNAEVAYWQNGGYSLVDPKIKNIYEFYVKSNLGSVFQSIRSAGKFTATQPIPNFPKKAGNAAVSTAFCVAGTNCTGHVYSKDTDAGLVVGTRDGIEYWRKELNNGKDPIDRLIAKPIPVLGAGEDLTVIMEARRRYHPLNQAAQLVYFATGKPAKIWFKDFDAFKTQVAKAKE